MLREEKRAKIEDQFTYHAPSLEGLMRLDAVNEAAKNLALVIAEHAPDSADQSAALRKVRDARMTANAAIVLHEYDELESITFERSVTGVGKGAIKLTGRAHAIMAQHRITGDEFRAGGLLVGSRVDNDIDVIVDLVSEPMEGDAPGHLTFDRAQPAHQEFVERAFRVSRRVVNYLGEWTTSRDESEDLSGRDQANLNRIVSATEFDGLELWYFVVTPTRVLCYEFDRSGRVELLTAR